MIRFIRTVINNRSIVYKEKTYIELGALRRVVRRGAVRRSTFEYFQIRNKYTNNPRNATRYLIKANYNVAFTVLERAAKTIKTVHRRVMRSDARNNKSQKRSAAPRLSPRSRGINRSSSSPEVIGGHSVARTGEA